MVSFATTRPETEEDRELYLRARLVTVACQDCLAEVQVKKNSERHTSIQWTPDAQSRCTEFARLEAQAGGRAIREVCPRLRASIDRAVHDGRVEIGAVDGY